MIFARCFEATAAGALMVIGMALIKDCFTGNTRIRALLFVQASMVIGPVLAPVIGGQILIVSTWHMTFWILSMAGIVCLFLTIFFKETLPKKDRLKDGVLRSVGHLASVLKHKNFTFFLLVSTLFAAMPFFAYLTVSSHIYETFFHATPQEYSFFFAANAGISTCGMFLYKPLTKLMSTKMIQTISMIACGLSGIAMFIFGEVSAPAFFITMLIFCTFLTMLRPFSVNYLLASVDTDTGSTSALINCSHYIFGCIGMLVLSPFSEYYVLGLALLIIVGAVLSNVFWFILLRSKTMFIKGLKEKETEERC
jgi:DHA1 family bicyclomycin/chloramphenicol resistance-like MFS transporter